MFYIISIVFGVISLLISILFRIVAVHSSFFNEHQNMFYIVFAMVFVFSYNYCVYDYKQSKILYILANLVFVILFVLEDKIISKNW